MKVGGILLVCINLTWYKTEKKEMREEGWRDRKRRRKRGRREEEKGEEERKKRKMMGNLLKRECLFKMCQEYEFRSYHWYLKIGETWVTSIISIFFLPECTPRTAWQTVLHRWGGDWRNVSCSGTERKPCCSPRPLPGGLPSSPGSWSCLLGLSLHAVGCSEALPPGKEWQPASLVWKGRSICVTSGRLFPIGEHYFCCLCPVLQLVCLPSGPRVRRCPAVSLRIWARGSSDCMHRTHCV